LCVERHWYTRVQNNFFLKIIFYGFARCRNSFYPCRAIFKQIRRLNFGTFLSRAESKRWTVSKFQLQSWQKLMKHPVWLTIYFILPPFQCWLRWARNLHIVLSAIDELLYTFFRIYVQHCAGGEGILSVLLIFDRCFNNFLPRLSEKALNTNSSPWQLFTVTMLVLKYSLAECLIINYTNFRIGWINIWLPWKPLYI
jgi:hypothetical protein